MNNYCIVIPNFNHDKVIEDTVGKLEFYGLPICIVDDASNDETKAVLAKLQIRNTVHVETHDVNQGKGGAVITGLRWAFNNGHSHVIQVDADGQHDTKDLERLISLSDDSPNALISGRPVYDESVPFGRLISRYITHFWVWVETLSFTINDSMCGFRCYPLDSVIKILNKTHVGRRMDFDIEIMVRLYWRGIQIIQFPTKVIYPEDGVSHFKLWRDNWLITKMHTRLFFGMLFRSPLLIYRKIRLK